MSSPFRQYLKQNSCYGKALLLSHPVLFTPDPHIACTNEILDHCNSVLWSYSEVVPKQEESKDFFFCCSQSTRAVIAVIRMFIGEWENLSDIR